MAIDSRVVFAEEVAAVIDAVDMMILLNCAQGL